MASPIPSRFRFLHLAVCTVIAAGLPAIPSSGQAPQSAAQRQPVLVELFTSEGCSDCPPADALLAQLDTMQPVTGAQAIVLSEHVTYWNHLGWRDPFSFDAMDQRQQNYARQFSLNSIYTPQVVVDGAAQLVGGDAVKLNSAIARAASTTKPTLTIGNAHRNPDGSVQFTLRASSGPKANVIAALAENATHSEISRGENKGRTLHHVAVVRALKDFGSNAADGRSLQLSGANLLNAEKDDEPLRLVVFLVNPINSHVVAVAEQTLGH
jgi:hypothetical protein